jgi:hypothetical protein
MTQKYTTRQVLMALGFVYEIYRDGQYLGSVAARSKSEAEEMITEFTRQDAEKNPPNLG